MSLKKCSITDVTNGMVLGRPVKSGPEAVLIQQGVVLHDRLLELLATRGIQHVYVESTEGLAACDPVDPEFRKQIGVREVGRFGEVAGNKVMQELLGATIEIKARQPQQWPLAEKAPVTEVEPPKPRDEILELAKKIQGLPTLPAIYLQVDRISRDQKASAADVAQVVSSDPAFAASLLRVANSALYSGKEEVSTVTRAVNLVGHKAIRDLCLTTSVLDIISLGNDNSRPVNHFWKHAVGVGSLAHVIGERVAELPREELFLSGLLHDIGQLFWLRYFPEDLARVFAYAESRSMTVLAAERKLLKTTHTRLGKMIAHHWNLPRSYVEVIACHHDLNMSNGQSLACLVVNVADVMAHALELAGPECARVPDLNPAVWFRLGMGLDEIGSVLEDALLAFEENKKNFALFTEEVLST